MMIRERDDVVEVITSVEVSYDFDLLVFIGRFQPFHFGHMQVVRTALARARHVLVLVGSPNVARSLRNPFTYEERQRMISDAVADLVGEALADPHGLTPASRVLIKPLPDFHSDDLWIREVQRLVYSTVADDLPAAYGPTLVVGLVGHGKDGTSFYLKLFPEFRSLDVPAFASAEQGVSDVLSSTDVRQRMFMRVLGGEVTDLTPFGGLSSAMPPSVRSHIDRVWQTSGFQELLAHVRQTESYKQAWRDAKTPFPVIFQTVDAVVFCNGHVLMVCRKHDPGRGRLALPGGFIRERERLFDAAVRELFEETQLALPRAVILGACVDRQGVRFDDPYRSDRGRTITQAFRFDLRLREKSLPKVKGGDDAASAQWVPVGALDKTQCFEDHGLIVDAMLARSDGRAA